MLFARFKFVEDNIKEVVTNDCLVKIWLKTGEYFSCYHMPKAVQNFIKYMPNESFTDGKGDNHYIAK